MVNRNGLCLQAAVAVQTATQPNNTVNTTECLVLIRFMKHWNQLPICFMTCIIYVIATVLFTSITLFLKIKDKRPPFCLQPWDFALSLEYLTYFGITALRWVTVANQACVQPVPLTHRRFLYGTNGIKRQWNGLRHVYHVFVMMLMLTLKCCLDPDFIQHNGPHALSVKNKDVTWHWPQTANHKNINNR